jgi:hypothetical protein
VGRLRAYDPGDAGAVDGWTWEPRVGPAICAGATSGIVTSEIAASGSPVLGPVRGPAGYGHPFSSSSGTSSLVRPKHCAYNESSASTVLMMVSARRKPWPSPSKAR